jgi:hypothetical protein
MMSHPLTSPFTTPSEAAIAAHPTLARKVKINLQRNQKQDRTATLNQAAQDFCYADCRDRAWQGEEFSLLYGTPLWEQASASQRLVLNHLYWVAYYSQIISAEIATIFFNQTSAAGLYALSGFGTICEMLDLESAQERAHIATFQSIATQIEAELFGERLFTYPMRGPFLETMIFAQSNRVKQWWKRLQLHSFGLLSAGNAFLACQYFTVRGLRTLNGKLIQHQLSHYCQTQPEPAPIPSQVSAYHFLDESFHFNSSTILSQEVIQCLPKPTKFEQLIANLGIRGCQQDHRHFSVVIDGIFWYDPALYDVIYRLLRSRIFEFDRRGAIEMLWQCFGQETDGLHRSFQTHQNARAAYQSYLTELDYVWLSNREMRLMGKAAIANYLKHQRQALSHFRPSDRVPFPPSPSEVNLCHLS